MQPGVRFTHGTVLGLTESTLQRETERDSETERERDRGKIETEIGT